MNLKLRKQLMFVSRQSLYLILFQVFTLNLLVCAPSMGQSINKVKVSINLENASLKDVFSTIEKQTEFVFVYNREVRNIKSKVSIRVAQQPVAAVLQILSRKYQLNFNQLGDNITVTKAKTAEKAGEQPAETPVDEIPISGQILDENNAGLPGASVMVKEYPTIGAITDAEGNFRFQAPNDARTIVVSFIGYISQEVKIGNSNIINVTLQPSMQTLEEVIVVGYGTQRKRDVTTSVASLKVDEVKDLAVAGFDQSLVGKLAGVQVLQTTGEPGEAATIKIRGTKSITAGTEPLYVIDGVPMDRGSQAIELINPNDIKSVEVLKDASAAAIYGSRGGNGVIIVTTKKGAAGALKVNYDAFYGLQQVSNKIDMLNAYQYAQLSKDGHDNAYLDAVPGGSINDQNLERPVGWQRTPPELFPYIAGVAGLTDTDWQEEIFRNAMIQRHSVSLSGGNQKINYFVSGTYFDQEGIIIHNNFTRYGLRINLNAEVDKFSFGLNFTPTFSQEDRVQAYGPYFQQGVVGSALQSSPTWPVRNNDGSFNFLGNGFWRIGTDYQHNEVLNPVALAALIDDDVRRSNIHGNLFAEYRLTDELKIRTTLASTYNNYHNDYYRPSTLPDRGAANFLSLSNPDAYASTTFFTNWLSETTLTYQKTFGDHGVNAIAGFSAQKNYRNQNRVEATNFPNDLVRTVNAGEVIDGTSTITEWSLLSYLGRVQYDYKGKYLLSAAIRTDGSSRFGENNRWGVFPSASFGWRISDEGFMAGVSFVNDLKLRVSYGRTGNFQIGNYDHIPRITDERYVLGTGQGSRANGIRTVNVANNDLGWETTDMLNAGLEASLLEGKVNLEVDYYRSLTSELLLEVPVPLATGFGSALTNIGEVANHGIELSLTTGTKLGPIEWNTNVNFSANTNEVKALGPEDAPIIKTAGTGHAFFITEVGQPIGSYYLLVQNGVFQNQGELDGYPHFSSTQVGDFRFLDVNGDGVLDVNDDRTIVGSYFPDFIYGFTNTFSYKGFDLNITFQGTQGNEVLNLNRRYIANMEGNFNNTTEALNRWRSEAEPGDGNTNRANRKAKGNNGRTSTWHLEDGSYLRLQNVTVGYTVPAEVAQKMGLQSLRVYLVGQNLATWSDYTGYNPEVSLYNSDALTPGVDYGTYPLARTISLGINVGL